MNNDWLPPYIVRWICLSILGITLCISSCTAVEYISAFSHGYIEKQNYSSSNTHWAQP